MASNFKIAVAVRDAMTDAAVDRLNGAIARLEVRNGTIPATTTTASGGTLLGTLTFADPAFAASSVGVAALASGITSDTDADASGTADFFRVYLNAAADTACEWQGTSGEAADSTDMTFDNKTVVAGGTIAVSAFTFTTPIQ